MEIDTRTSSFPRCVQIPNWREFRVFMKLTAGIWASCLVGSTYAFGILSNQMKTEFDLGQEDMTTITTVSFVIGMFNFPAGVLYDAKGPRLTNLAGTLMLVITFLMFALSFAKIIPVTVVTLSIWNAFGVSGGGYFDVGTLMTNLFNFPENRGEVIILQKTFMGLGGTFLAVFYSGFFEGDFLGYCLFVMFLCIIFGGICVAFVTLPELSAEGLRTLEDKKQNSASCNADGETGKGERTNVSSPSAGGNFGTSHSPRANYHDLPTTDASQHATTMTSAGANITTGTAATAVRFEDQGEDDIDDAESVIGEGGVVHRSKLPPTVIAACHSKESYRRLDSGRIRVGFVLLTFTIIYLSFASLLPAYVDLSRGVLAFMGVVSLVTLLAFFLIAVWSTPSAARRAASIPPSSGEMESNTTEEELRTDEIFSLSSVEMKDATLLSPTSQREASTSRGEKDTVQNNERTTLSSGQPPTETEAPLINDDHNQYTTSFWKSLRTLPYWSMYYTSFGLWGIGVVVVVNCPQIYRSINNDHFVSSTNSLLVAAIGVGSALGRVSAGILEKMLSKRHRSITWTYPMPSILGTIGVAMFLFMPAEGLVLPFFIYSYAYGMSWAATVLSVRRMYQHDVGKHYDFLFSSGMLSVILLNRLLFGILFDEAGRHMGLYPHCSGRVCVFTSFACMSVISASTILSSMYVHYAWLQHSGMK